MKNLEVARFTVRDWLELLIRRAVLAATLFRLNDCAIVTKVLPTVVTVILCGIVIPCPDILKAERSLRAASFKVKVWATVLGRVKNLEVAALRVKAWEEVRARKPVLAAASVKSANWLRVRSPEKVREVAAFKLRDWL